jgi:hypothetical protein
MQTCALGHFQSHLARVRAVDLVTTGSWTLSTPPLCSLLFSANSPSPISPAPCLSSAHPPPLPKSICRDPGSNRGPSDLRSDALPTELSRLMTTSQAPGTTPMKPDRQGVSRKKHARWRILQGICKLAHRAANMHAGESCRKHASKRIV